jgi:DNA-binding transcriptional MerR regulator
MLSLCSGDKGNAMLKIGEFSRLTQVAVPTLRYYDQIGLLKPVGVDTGTGYRYYSVAQLPQLHRILALKGLGFSLEQIAAVLDEGLTAEQMRGMLRLRHAQISQQISDMHDQLLEVEVRLSQIEREDALTGYDVILKQSEPLLVASIRAILPSHGAVGMLYEEVCAALGERMAEALGPEPGANGQTLALWYDNEFKETDVDGAAAFILRRRVPDSGRMCVHELPATMVASTIHHGAYITLNAAHEAVARWIEANGYRISGPDREIYLYNRHPSRRDDPTYITEIQYPVEKVIS